METMSPPSAKEAAATVGRIGSIHLLNMSGKIIDIWPVAPMIMQKMIMRDGLTLDLKKVSADPIDTAPMTS